jgi:hypothetical protein
MRAKDFLADFLSATQTVEHTAISCRYSPHQHIVRTIR